MPKDIDPFASSQQFIPPANNETQVGMTLVPEMPVDLSSLNLGGNAWSLPTSRPPMGQFMPQVFAVVEVPEPAEPINFAALSGKSDDDILAQITEEEKASYPIIESPVPSKAELPLAERPVISESVDLENEIDENDESMILYASSAPCKASEPVETYDNLFGDVAPEKVFAHFELLVSTEEDNQDLLNHFERMCSRLDARCSRLDSIIGGL